MKIKRNGKEYQVRYHHYRLSEVIAENSDLRSPVSVRQWCLPARVLKYSGLSIFPRGGYTVAFIGNEDDIRAQAIATCSIKDNYNKRVGRELALARLLELLGEA